VNSMFMAPVTRMRDGLVARRFRPTDIRSLLGVWVNYDGASSGICRIEIGDWENIPTVRVFGAARPVPVDWGEVAGAAFTDGTGTGAVAFDASYDFGHLTVLLAGCLEKRLLMVDTFSTFTDSSGRANYYQRDRFYLP